MTITILIIIFTDKTKSITMTDTNFFGTIDMRNAKYQGGIKDKSPDGLGMLFTIDHTFALSTWKNNIPQGTTLIVYPNRNYLYCQINNKKIQGLAVYQLNNGSLYYLKYLDGVAQKIAFDENNGVINQMAFKEQKLTVISSQKVKLTNRWESIGRIVGDVPASMKNLKSYLKQTFQNKHPQLLQISQTSGVTTLNFKNIPSLGLKFDKIDKIRQIGIFQPFTKTLQFGRKYTQSTTKGINTQQGRFTNPQKTFTYSKSRPIDAVRLTEQYFKSGTRFKNVFFKVEVFDGVQNYLKGVEKEVMQIAMLQYGQSILEKDRKKEEDHFDNKEYTINQVKKQIYAAVQRRHNGRKTDRVLQESRSRQDKLTPSHGYLQLKYHNQYQQDLNINKHKVMSINTYKSKQKSYQQSNKQRTSPRRYIYTEIVKNQLDSGYSRDNHVREFNLYQESGSPQKGRRNVFYPGGSSQQREEPKGRTKMEERISPYQHTFGAQNEQPAKKTIKSNPFSAIGDISPRRHVYKPNSHHQQSPIQPHQPKDRYTYIRQDFQYKNPKQKAIGEPLVSNSGFNKYKEESKQFQHYVKYKNRNKSPVKKEGQVEKGYLGKRYQIYEKKSGNRERDLERSINVERENGVGGGEETRGLVSRHRKNFKYL